MPTYSYFAKSLRGEQTSGVLEAKNEHELARVLRLQGYLLISSRVEGEEPEKKKLSISLPFFNRVSLADKIFFTRNLKVMIAAGVPLPRALRILSNQTKSKKFKNALLNIVEEITKGKSFSDSLGKHSGIFSELFLSMVKVGEEGGTLEDVLVVLTGQMEREHEIVSKVKGAMVYPIVIVSAMVIIGILMMIMVIPKLSQTFIDLGIELPLTTKIVIFIGNFLAKFWYLLPVILIALFILFRVFLRTKFGRRTIDTIALKAPLISTITKKSYAASTVRTLSSLISAGVPIVRALEVVAGTMSNSYYKKAISEAAEKVKKGSKLAESLKPYDNIYPSLVVQMIEIGEETGETSNILQKLAEFFEEEVTRITQNLSSVIEPILMILIGLAVGFFAISMIQPMYGMIKAF